MSSRSRQPFGGSMARSFRPSASKPTAVGSVILALSGLAALGCGGKGERLKANATVAMEPDAGPTIDPCRLSEKLEISQFGCTPGKSVVAGGNAYTSFCLDWDGVLDKAGNPTGATPSGGFVYTDAIVSLAVSEGAHADSKIIPSAVTQARMPADLPPHCSEQKDVYAFHITAYGQDIWGPQFGVKFTSTTDGPLPPVDVSSYNGFGFWIKMGTTFPADYPEDQRHTMMGSTLFVALIDSSTTSSDYDEVPPCNDKSNYDARKCDPYGMAVGFDTDWRFVMIPFDELRQRGYGVFNPGLDRQHVSQIKFSMDIGDGANGNWNVWVDDVVLYRHKTVAGSP
jgi:hypothetical protein